MRKARLYLWGARTLYLGPAFGFSPHRNAVAVLCAGVEGPGRYTTQDLLQAVSRATGRSISPLHIPQQAWKQTLTRAGLTESYADLVAGMYAASNAWLIEVEPGGAVRRGTTALETAFAGAL